MQNSIRVLVTLISSLANHILPQGKPTEHIAIEEPFAEGTSLEISSSVTMQGKVLGSKSSGQDRISGAISASGQTRYRERILEARDHHQVSATARHYIVAELEKKTTEGTQRIVLRPRAERIVCRRTNHENTVFSPDCSLTSAELDFLRADLFTPTLAGLLPSKPVKPGDQWEATPEAVSELTGIGPIESGGISCVFRELQPSAEGPAARVNLSGSLAGPSELGLTRQTVEGYFLFDIDHRLISYLMLRGRSEIRGAKGEVVGELVGRHELIRRPSIDDPRLTDASLTGLDLQGTIETTALVFEGNELGVRFLYPRNWELSGVSKNLIRLDEPTGGKMRLTIDPSPMPTAEKLRGELLGWLQSQKAVVQKAGSPQALPLAEPRQAERFAVQASLPRKLAESKQSETKAAERDEYEWDYVQVRRENRSATVSACLTIDRAATLRSHVDFVARSLEFLPKPR